jgi:hypothetical protein
VYVDFFFFFLLCIYTTFTVGYWLYTIWPYSSYNLSLYLGYRKRRMILSGSKEKREKPYSWYLQKVYLAWARSLEYREREYEKRNRWCSVTCIIQRGVLSCIDAAFVRAVAFDVCQESSSVEMQ